ncbi:helix-turn-helix domain-containing protein [Gemmiger sp.]|uniref:helix-turn-helix domain-containing protein n=1 Tax=Gemmiger sp. TaxID=2049027 RepID=UPI003AB5A280
MSFYEKYLMLCDKNKKTPSGAALEMGLSKTTVNRWKNGGGITDATILKVASYFGIPKEELTGEEPEQKEKPTPGEGSGLDARFDALLSQMTDADRADLLEYMEFKVAKRKENPNG